MLEYIVVGLLCLIVGYRLARLKNAIALKRMERRHVAARHQLHEDAYIAGARAALNDFAEVHRAYHKMTSTLKVDRI